MYKMLGKTDLYKFTFIYQDILWEADVLIRYDSRKVGVLRRSSAAGSAKADSSSSGMLFMWYCNMENSSRSRVCFY